MDFKGTTGNDTFTGTAGADKFLIFQGGNDTVTGNAGNDLFYLKSAFTAADTIDGGGNKDTVILAGDYTFGLVFNATTMTNVEILSLRAGNSYNLTTDDATVAAGARLFVDASALNSPNTLVFDGSAETDGRFKLTGGSGNDTLTGGAGNDLFDLTRGGNDIAHGGGGADIFRLGTQQLGSDQIDGGAGNDTVSVTGNATFEVATFGPQTLTNVEALRIAGPRFSFTTNDATVAAGATLTVQSTATQLTFNGAAETDGHFSFIATGTVGLTGGALSDTFDLRNAVPTSVAGGGGNDTFMLGAHNAGISGGAGNDHVLLSGGSVGGSFWSDVERLTLVDDVNSTLDLTHVTVSGGQTFSVDARVLTTHSLSVQAPFNGDMKILAGGGDDSVFMDGTLTASDSIDGGGGGANIVYLNGDYSAGLTMSATTLVNVQTLNLDGSDPYKLTMNNANVAAGQQLWVNDINTFSTTAPLTLDASAETSGSYKVWATYGDDVVTTGGGADQLSLFDGNDTANTGAGNDKISTSLSSGDHIDGGSGVDELDVGTADASVTADFYNIEKLVLTAGIDLTMTDANVTKGTFTLDGHQMGEALVLDASTETSNAYHVTTAFTVTTNDTIETGGGADIIDLYLGNDTVHAGGGNDTINIGSGANPFTAADSIDGGAGNDTVVVTTFSPIAPVTFTNTTMTNVETLQLLGGVDYTLQTADATVAAGARFTVDASNLVRFGGGALVFDGSLETNGRFTLIGGSVDDALTGGALADTFDLSYGGSDTAHGGGGDDIFVLGSALDAGDNIDGGAGSDRVTLGSDYAGFVFGATTMTNVETLQLLAGHDYSLTSSDGTVAAGETLAVNAKALGAGDSVTFNGSAETDGAFIMTGGAGGNTFTGGAQSDTFDMTQGGIDTVNGGGGGDSIRMGATLTAADAIDGGAGQGTVFLNGDYDGGNAVTFGANTMVNVENLVLGTGHSYVFTANDATVASGAGLTVDASALGSGNQLLFDAQAETDGHFVVTGGAGADSINLGGPSVLAASTIDGGAGYDTLSLNGDYAAGVTFSATTVTNVENLVLSTGHTYDLTTDDNTVAAAATLTVDGSGLGAGNALQFDGSAETDGSFSIDGGAGDDTLTGGANADTFDLSLGGTDTVSGGNGDDTFSLGASFDSNDKIDGGAGYDVLKLDGNYFALGPIGATTLKNVDEIDLSTGVGPRTYALTVTSDFVVAAGDTLKVDASALTASDSAQVNESVETDGHLDFIGGGGDDIAYGGALADTLDLSGGGDDLVSGGGGDDTILVGGTLTEDDGINGGAGNDTLALNGHYSDLNLGAGIGGVVSVETFTFAAGNNYNLTTVDGTVAAGATLTVDGSALGGADGLTFDGSAETDGFFAFSAGAGNDTLTGGAQADSFDLTQGGADTAHGGGGGDTFTLGGALSSDDAIDGGIGNDTLALNGDYSAGLTLGTLTSVETITFAAGSSYKLTTIDSNVASGATLTVDGSALGIADTLTFDGSAETNGFFAFKGGAGNDTLTGGNLADSFDLSQAGNDTITGGSGNDTFNLGAAFTAADAINGGTGTDTLNLNGDYSAGLVLAATTIVNVETIRFAAGHSYNITTNDANVVSLTLSVDGSALGAGDSLSFNGAAETTNSLNMTGGAGDDVLVGGAGLHSDSFDITKGGNDHVTGGASSDSITAGAALTAADTISGGAGSDTLFLSGDYSGGLVFGATTISGIEKIILGTGNSYNLTTNDANVASGQVLQINVVGTLNLDARAETDGRFDITSFSGGDVSVALSSAAVLSNSHFTGGTGGTDTLTLDGDFSGGATLQSLNQFERLVLTAGHSYNLTATEGTLPFFDEPLTVDASALASDKTLTFDGTAEANSGFNITGGAGNDVLTGSQQSDTINGGDGNDIIKGGDGTIQFIAVSDTLDGGAGNDEFVYASGIDSDSDAADTIIGLDLDHDTFHIAGGVAGVDGVYSANESLGSLDSDLGGALAGHLAANTAAIVNFGTGDFAGQSFLVVEMYGDAGYQYQDLVIEITGYTGTLTSGNFV